MALELELLSDILSACLHKIDAGVNCDYFERGDNLAALSQPCMPGLLGCFSRGEARQLSVLKWRPHMFENAALGTEFGKPRHVSNFEQLGF